jgi:integration host factor subunit beta
MTRSDLVEKLYQLYPEFGRRLIEDAVSLFFFEISMALKRGDRVEIRGFGSFCLRERKGRVARNPKTGEKVSVCGKKVPFFRAGRELKMIVNQPHYSPLVNSDQRTDKPPDLHIPQYVPHP